MVRIWVAISLALVLNLPASAQDDAARKRIIEEIRRGAAEAAGSAGAADWLDVLEKRFPADYNALMDQLVAKGTMRDAKQATARLIVEIQRRDGDHIKRAPTPALRAVLEAQRSVMDAVARHNPELCKTMLTGSSAFTAPSPDIARTSAAQLIAVFDAIADGRDEPVASRGEVTDADYEAFGREALKRGIDVASWSVLDPEETKSASGPAVCNAMLSSFDAILATEGVLGEKLLVDQATGLLRTDMGFYQNAIK
jgi:hypothetical protein